MAIIDEQHLALIAGPVGLAASLAVAGHDIRRAGKALDIDFEPYAKRQLGWASSWTEGAAAGLRETLRRARENELPDLGEPDVPEVAAELVATLAEAYGALRIARAEILAAGLSDEAEPVAGRWGELAAQIADWADAAIALQDALGRRPLRPPVPLPPDPGDPRVRAPLALSLTACFCVSAALGGMALVHEHRSIAGVDHEVQTAFDIAAQALWAAAELSAGVALCLDHLLSHPHPLPEGQIDVVGLALASSGRACHGLRLQIDDLQRHQPVTVQETEVAFRQLLGRLERDVERIRALVGDRR